MSQRALKLLPIDEDPIFLLGLVTLCQQFPDLEVVDRATDSTSALHILATLADRNSSSASDFPAPTEILPVTPVDLVIVDLHLGRSRPEGLSGFTLIEQLHRQYPTVPVLALSSWPDREELHVAYRAGAKGYCAKGIAGSELVKAIHQVASGQTYWGTPPESSELPRSGGVVSTLLEQARWSGLGQIDAELTQLDEYLRNEDLSRFNRLFLEGRERELLVARWIVNKLLAPPVNRAKSVWKTGINGGLNSSGDTRSSLASTGRQRPEPRDNTAPQSSQGIQVSTHTGELLPASESQLNVRNLQAQIWDAILAKLESRLENLTGVVMEIEILRVEKKRELLYLVFQQVEEILAQLRYSQVQVNQLPAKRDRIVRDLWEMTTTEFFGKYYSLWIGEGNPYSQELREFELVPVLLQDAELVEREILNKIPLVVDLLAYLLYQVPLAIDNVSYAADSPQAMQRAESLLENLVIQVANGVMQPLLNRVADVEVIKQSFFERQWLSSREIERFRNDLSWKYRREKSWIEPKAIFESQYWLFILADRGIRTISIYSPRSRELGEISGIPLAVTLLLETRDAIAPRVRALLMSVGNGARYLLIQLGRGIGLIGRGILQGIGSSFQDNRFDKKREEPK